MATRVDVKLTRTDTFERVVRALGNAPEIRGAMARGLNEHLRKQHSQAKTLIAVQTGIGQGIVASGASVRFANAGSLEGAIRQQGGAFEAGEKTSRSWSRSDPGAKHGDWPTYTNKGGRMKDTFMANGKIYRRTTSKRLPIARVWGPVLPNEMMRQDMPARAGADRLVGADLERSVIRAIMHAFGF